VATYRRPVGLLRLIESLRRQKLPAGTKVEVIVVDNDPEGRALAHVDGGRERWCHEPRRDIAHARNRALEEARGTWIAFVDDDEVADEGWLAAYLALAESGGWDGLFGPVIPRLERVVTPWLELETFYARARHASGTPLGPTQLRTSNAFVRRTLFDGRRFDPAYGRSGGSDSELFGRMLAAGARFGFCDEARVTETLSPERHTLRWLTRRAFRGGVVSSRMVLDRDPRARRIGIPRALALLLGCAAALPLALGMGRVAAARVWLRGAVQAGHLWAFAGRSFQEYADTARD
jgi:glycosyltransferase involved in cell wall biosynthesis